MRNPCALATQLNTMITSAILLNTHNDVSKKARPKGHIATKLYNCIMWQRRTLQLRQEIILTNAPLLRFVISVPIIGKT